MAARLDQEIRAQRASEGPVLSPPGARGNSCVSLPFAWTSRAARTAFARALLLASLFTCMHCERESSRNHRLRAREPRLQLGPLTAEEEAKATSKRLSIAPPATRPMLMPLLPVDQTIIKFRLTYAPPMPVSLPDPQTYKRTE
ncbi:hypothetical protein SRHO_G00220370 [Serrasalmus rhombeus]